MVRTNTSTTRKLTIALLAVLTALAVWLGKPSAPAFAASSPDGIELRADIGFSNAVKEGKWTRLRTTVTNLTDRDLKGELSLTVVLPNGGHNQKYAVPAELPKGSPIEIEITVPGMSYNKQNNRIAFTDTSGKDVPVAIGKPYVEVSSIGMSTVGVVARDPDTLNFLPILNQKGYNLKVIPIAEKDVPNTLQQLEGFDVLLLNDVATAEWSDLRKSALRSWVQQGGTLIAAGGAGYAKTAEAIRDLVPVVPEGTAALDATKGLEQWGDGKPLAAGYPVTVSTGKLQAGYATAVSDGMIVAAERDYGRGKVAYAAFDPSLEPFVSWTGSPIFWSHFLSGSVNPYSQTGIPSFGSINESWEISNALNQFPSIKTPAYSLLLIFFIAYLLIVAPGLFLLLRKFDRREWAWWIIPIVSIVSSVVIFTIGSSDKSSTQTHSLRTMELSGTGEAVRSASVAVFVPRGGDVTATFDAGAIALPYQSDGNGGTGNVLTNSTEQAIRLLPGHTEVEWKDVPYWSIRKTWMQYSSASSGHGQFSVALNKKAATYEVDVRNDTEADLTHVYLLHYGNVYPAGDLKKGESGKVVVPIGGPGRTIFYSDYGSQLFQQWNGNGQDRYARERGLLNGYMNQLANKGSTPKPVIVGFSNDNIGWFDVNGKKAKADNLTLWVQSFELSDPSGKASGDIEPGTVQPVITNQAMQGFGYDAGSGRLDLYNGSLEFEYAIPQAAVAGDETSGNGKVTVYQNEPLRTSQAELFVWNGMKQQWEEIDGTLPTISLPEPAVSYLAGTKAIRFKIESKDQMNYYLPSIGVEGKVKP